MAVRVKVAPSVYKWALERCGREVDELIGKFPKLREWMVGDRDPTLRQIEQFAQATGTAVGYFFLPEPPDEQIPIPDLRTIGDQTVARPSGNLLDTIYLCRQRQDWYRDYALDTGLPELEWVDSLDTKTPPMGAARTISRTLGFSVEQRGADWSEAFTKLRNRAEEIGALVMVSGVVGSNNHRRLDPREFRGFALVDPWAPLVFVNGSDTKAAQVFTLVHELAHIWHGESALSDVDLGFQTENRVERWCNQVAVEILVPIQVLYSEFDPGAGLQEELPRLARKFKTSTLVVLRRIQEAGYLTWEAYRELYDAEYERAILSPPGSGGGFYNTQPARVSPTFARAIIASTLEGHTSYTDAFQMLGSKKTSTFYNLAERLGVT